MSENTDTGEVDEELKKKLIAMTYAITPNHNSPIGKEEMQKSFIESIEKYVSPDYKDYSLGFARSRDEYVKNFENITILKVKFHNQQFTRADNTIIVHGLLDTIIVMDGKEIETKGINYCDIFTFSNDRWLMLATFILGAPTSQHN